VSPVSAGFSVQADPGQRRAASDGRPRRPWAPACLAVARFDIQWRNLNFARQVHLVLVYREPNPDFCVVLTVRIAWK
jgi:hypothetical protein